ncbi:MCM DNA helicase complex subunit MCM4 [Sugiyamaella lignohabitans]|uniref:DNA replication licensing factor MCM4 n=1 Tax=Sugiyamaella lignohabitans TaxID=796027 RepID=A0A167E9Z4_9ASCO|nr:MCM DNA helicase complex subunit MCM4 [Sugiyamaella lignohabitans]ANB13822.1 MCM DNA helicase complex subunit MCM4 [Sugiyamaella lignohabitans]
MASSPPAPGDSSPLFFNSVTSSSPIRARASQDDGALSERAGRLRIEDVSSPLGYPSSERDHTLYSASRNGRSSHFSETDNISADNHHRSYNRRGDIFSSDLTPSRRMLVSSDGHAPSDSGLFTLSARGSDVSETGNPGDPVRLIWGTNVSIAETMNSFRSFLQSFKSKYRMMHDDIPIGPGEGEDLVYVNMMNQMRILGSANLNLDAQNLLAYPATHKLYYQLINYPYELVPIMDQVIKDCMVTLVTTTTNGGTVDAKELEATEMRNYKVRPFGIDNKRGMRDLNPGDIDKLVTVKGLVLRATPVIPDMKEAFFKCIVCSHTVVVEIDRGTITEPTKCPRPVCGRTNSMQIVHNRCLFADKQVIRLQETPDITPDGQTPHSISLCVYDELVDICKAGDRVEVTGIFRSVPVRINPRQRTLKSLFKTYVDILHVQKVDKKRMGIDVTTNLEAEVAEQQQADVEETRKITEDDIAKIKEVAARDDLYDLLARSLAPSIYEQDDVKKGILLQLFGGSNKTFEKGGSPRYRGDINILLCGDPSTSKSQMLQYVHKIAPRGIYTSGKGSSAVGLTAYVTRDIETKQLVLESGALVLSDGGICCIDEFDKMSDATRSVLHEVMEQQTISIAKAGIITTLNARTSILASANPIGSKYDVKLSVPQNIDLPPSLLSRFDLVYLMIDKIDAQADRHLANHLTRMYAEDVPENAATSEILPVEFLTLYISYAKNLQPQITPEAKDELVKAYVAMRKLGEDSRTAEKRITATTRQLESMIRLSEAHAKMRLSEVVTADDVLEAVRLIRSAIKEYAMDPITGTIDMDLVQTGTSSAQRRLRVDLKENLLSIMDTAIARTGSGGTLRYDELVRLVADIIPTRVENLELGNALRSLEQEGKIVMTGSNTRRTIRRVTGLV